MPLGGPTRGKANMRMPSFYERALTTFERAFGPDHTDVGWSISWRSAAYLGDIQRAKPLLERASRIFETNLGADHVAVSWCANDLAVAYQNVGDFASAKVRNERACASS